MIQKVTGGVASVYVNINSSADYTIPLPAGWTKVTAAVACPSTALTRCIVLADGVNRTVKVYYDGSSGAGNKTFFYILFGE